MPNLPIRIETQWDAEASVWWAKTDDISGFVMEDETLDGLIARAPDVLLDLIEGNHPELLTCATIPFVVHAVRTGFIEVR
jgi:hypothetical protein